MDVTIRRAVMEDAAILVEFNRRMAEETEGIHLDPGQLAPGVVGAVTDESQALYFVAECQGQVVGQVMVTFEWSDWRNGAIWWLQSVYVAPEFRRQGIFRRLYEHVVQEGQKAGAAHFRLYVVEDNHAAQQAYLRMGMKRTPYIVMEYP